MEKIIIIAFILITVQGILTYFQTKNFKNKIISLKNRGLMGFGSKKGYIRPGSAMVLVCDSNGIIVHGEKMEGITVFTRFKEIEGIKGFPVSDLKKTMEEKVKGRKFPLPKHVAMKQALEDLEKRLAKI